MASGAVFTDGGSLQVGHPQERRQARNGRWYTEEEFRWYYEKAWRSYWDGARRETVPLCASQSVSSQRARRSASATELPSAHVAPPASSVVHAAEPAAALVAPGASTGAHAVEPAAAPATPGASTKAPAAETAAAPVAPGASRPGLSEGAKPNPAGKYAAAGPAAGLATLGASTVVHAAEPAVAPVSSEASTAAHAVENIAGPLAPGASQPEPFSVDGTVVPTAVQLQGRQAVEEAGKPSPDLSDGTPGAAAEPAAALVPPGASQPEVGPAGGTVAPTVSHLLKGQAVAEARELKPVSSDGTPGAAASLAAPGASQIGPLQPRPPTMPPPPHLLAGRRLRTLLRCFSGDVERTGGQT